MPENFIDVIPDLAKVFGVSTLEYMPVVIKMAREKNFQESADWFQQIYDKLKQRIAEEYDEVACSKPISEVGMTVEATGKITDWGSLTICHHPAGATYNHRDYPNRYDCYRCGGKDIIY